MKVVLLGDSNRLIGYGPIVEKYFKEKGVDVYQPSDNCRFSKYLLRMLFDLKEELKDADIIHFNVGKWDSCRLFDDHETFSSLEEYRNNLTRITKILLTITPNLIFATNLPVREEHPHEDNKTVEEFNRVALEVMKSFNVRIDDLCSLVKEDIYEYICEDCMHLSEHGKQVCAEQVIRSIEEYK